MGKGTCLLEGANTSVACFSNLSVWVSLVYLFVLFYFFDFLMKVNSDVLPLISLGLRHTLVVLFTIVWVRDYDLLGQGKHA